ncbi:RE1 [Symbiodinium sp. KB8]|nr:RE1 [Symbiodinium sp. KB8]
MSGATETTSSHAARTKDGIPTWGGEASSFVQYEEAALLWEQSLTWEKRYTAGPRLVQELTGAAKRFVAGQPAGWVAWRGGVTVLMDHLRKALGKPRVNEVTDLLATYFKGTKRRSGESMNEYITRKNEAYMRATQALRRVQPHYEAGDTRPPLTAWNTGRRSSGDSWSVGWHRQWSPSGDGDGAATEGVTEEATEGSTRASEAQESQGAGSWNWSGHHPGWLSWQGGSWQPYWHGAGSSWSWSTTSADNRSESSELGSLELLPAFIQGWYLLTDSNLDHSERNLVVTALNGNFSPQRVGQELRNQFPEGETRRRDGRRFQGFMGEKAEDEAEEDEAFTYSRDELEADGINEEGISLIAEAESEAQEALAALQEARRTLKDARFRQKMVKQSRKYYGSGGPQRGSGSNQPRPPRVRDDSKIDCLRCGQIGHRAVNCPNRPSGSASQTDLASGQKTESAPFVCFTEAAAIVETRSKDDGFAGFVQDDEVPAIVEEAFGTQPPPGMITTQEAVKRGMCVIDGGATQTIGSVAALEAVLEQNRMLHGSSRLRNLDTSNPPVFSFGNSTENKCLSTAKLEVSANGQRGEIKVHALDQGQSPILMSVDTLRSLGAIIDFKSDLAVFRALDDKRVIHLTRGQSGHQLLSLTEDWMTHAEPTTCAVPDLSSYLRKPLSSAAADHSRGMSKDAQERSAMQLSVTSQTCRETQHNFMMTMIAAILAHLIVPLLYILEIYAMDSMNRKDLVLHLQAFGEEPPEAWTKVELKQRIQDLMDQGEMPAMKSKKERTELQMATTAINQASRKKAELIRFAEEHYGIQATSNDTIGTLQRKLMAAALANTRPHGDDLMGFGKFSGRTYRNVMNEEPKYMEWARATAAEGDCSAYLKRFIRWVQNYADAELPEEPAVKTTPVRKSNPKAHTKAMAKKGYEPPKGEGMNSASSTNEAMQNLTMVVASLVQEVKTLKEERAEERAEMPRKIVARDAEMNQKAKRAHATRILENVIEVVKVCIQLGWEKMVNCFRRDGDWLDPAGAFRSQAVEDWCDKHGIFLDVVPGEAHWKVGTCENAVGGVKEVMSKLCQYDEHLSAEEALSEAVAVFNHKELVRGFSPAQHLLGQAPDETGRFLAACNQLPPGLLCENADGEFARSVKLRAEAEKAQCEWSAKQRILRAKHSRHRPCYNYQPGELVFYWRCQDSKKGRRQPGGKHGRFLGPARILATESRKDEAGQIRPGGAVWLVKGRSLLKCSPEQLRRASQREELLEALAGPHEQEAPWTFHTVAEQIGGNRYEDISNEKPDDAEWNRAQCPDEEVQPTRYRLRTKRPVATTTPDDVEVEPEPTDLGGEASASRQRSRSRGRRSGPNEGVPEQLVATAWWNDIKEQDWPEAQSSYWADTQAAIEIAIPLPDSKRGADRAWRDLGAYFVGSMRRRAVELSERRMSAAELEAFKGAKAIEVKNFVASKAFEVLPPHMRPDRQQAIGMRWILTWKLKEDGSRKAKARAVLLGYQDGSYEHRKTTSPVMTRQTRQLLLQMAAWRRWQVQKGDVTGAFLQSRTYPDQLYCIPCPEICQALGIEPGSITRVKRACYGLVDAPLEWYRSVDSFMKQIGFERLWSDSCCWVLRENGALRGMVSGHVDDFLFAGKTGDTLWESKLQAIREQFKWGDWESGKFTQCGVLVEVTRSTVDTMIRANILLAQAKAKQGYKMQIHGHDPNSEVMFVAWVDAANGNRVDGGSTQGIFVGATATRIMEGDICDVSPVSWASQKIDRSCRSPGASEAQAAVNGEDTLYSIRFQWGEMLNGVPDLHRPDSVVRAVKGCVVTDSRNVYDKLETEVLVVKGAEKRTSIEMLAVKESQICTEVQMRWVHSEAQLANTLTKAGATREYDLFYKMGHRWRLVEDPTMMSARRRKQMGLQPLEQADKKSKVKGVSDLESDQLQPEPTEL